MGQNFRKISISLLNFENRDIGQNFRKISIFPKFRKSQFRSKNFGFRSKISKSRFRSKTFLRNSISIKIFENLDVGPKFRFRSKFRKISIFPKFRKSQFRSKNFGFRSKISKSRFRSKTFLRNSISIKIFENLDVGPKFRFRSKFRKV